MEGLVVADKRPEMEGPVEEKQMPIMFPGDLNNIPAKLCVGFDVSCSQWIMCKRECPSCRGSRPFYICMFMNVSPTEMNVPEFIPFGAYGGNPDYAKEYHTITQKGPEMWTGNELLREYGAAKNLASHTALDALLGRTSPLARIQKGTRFVLYTDGALTLPGQMKELLNLMKSLGVLPLIGEFVIIFAPHTTSMTIAQLTETYTQFLAEGNAIPFKTIHFTYCNPNQWRDFLIESRQMTFGDIDMSLYHNYFGKMYVLKSCNVLHSLLSGGVFVSDKYKLVCEAIQKEMLDLAAINPELLSGEGDINDLARCHRFLVKTPLKKVYNEQLSTIMNNYTRAGQMAKVAAIQKLLTASKATPQEELAELMKELLPHITGVLLLPGEITSEQVRKAMSDGSMMLLKELVSCMLDPLTPLRIVELVGGVIPPHGMPVVNCETAPPNLCRDAMSFFFRGIPKIDDLLITGTNLTSMLVFILSSNAKVPEQLMKMIMTAFLDENYFIRQIGMNLVTNAITLPPQFASPIVVRSLVDCLHLYGEGLLAGISPASRNAINKFFRIIETTYSQASAFQMMLNDLPKDLEFHETLEIEKPVGRFGITVGCICFVKPFCEDPRVNVPTVFIVLAIKGRTVWGCQLDQRNLLHVDVDAVSPFPYPDTHNIQKSNAIPISPPYITGGGFSSIQLVHSGDHSTSISTDLHFLSFLPADHPIMLIHTYLLSLIDQGGVYSLGHPLIPEVLAQAKDRVIEIITGAAAGARTVSGDITVKIPQALLINYIGYELDISEYLLSYIRQRRYVDMDVLLKIISEHVKCRPVNMTQKHFIEGIEANVDLRKFMEPYLRKVQSALCPRVLGGLSELKEMSCANCCDIHPIKEFHYLECHHVICEQSNTERIEMGALVPGQEFHTLCHMCPHCKKLITSSNPIIDAYMLTNIPAGTINSCCDTCEGLFGQVLACGVSAVRATTCPTCIATAARLHHEAEVARIGLIAAQRDANELAIAQRVIVECPECCASISREYGCDVMNCKCGAHFCYGCCTILPEDVYDWKCCTRIENSRPFTYTNCGKQCTNFQMSGMMTSGHN